MKSNNVNRTLATANHPCGKRNLFFKGVTNISPLRGFHILFLKSYQYNTPTGFPYSVPRATNITPLRGFHIPFLKSYQYNTPTRFPYSVPRATNITPLRGFLISFLKSPQ